MFLACNIEEHNNLLQQDNNITQSKINERITLQTVTERKMDNVLKFILSQMFTLSNLHEALFIQRFMREHTHNGTREVDSACKQDFLFVYLCNSL